MGNSKDLERGRKGRPVKPKDSKPGLVKPAKKKITAIASSDLHDARNDELVEAFLLGTKERGERLWDEGLIHK
jgi:hypothetical protein